MCILHLLSSTEVAACLLLSEPVSRLKWRAASAEGVFRSWGRFHTPGRDEGCSKDYTWSGVQRQIMKRLLGENEGKFCLVTMKANQWLQHLTPKEVRTRHAKFFFWSAFRLALAKLYCRSLAYSASWHLPSHCWPHRCNSDKGAALWNLWWGKRLVLLVRASSLLNCHSLHQESIRLLPRELVRLLPWEFARH